MLEDGSLKPTERLVGLNDIGMVAWHATMKTPEYPNVSLPYTNHESKLINLTWRLSLLPTYLLTTTTYIGS